LWRRSVVSELGTILALDTIGGLVEWAIDH